MLYKCSLEELHLSFNEMKTPFNTEIILPKVTQGNLHYDGNCVEHQNSTTGPALILWLE